MQLWCIRETAIVYCHKQMLCRRNKISCGWGICPINYSKYLTLGKHAVGSPPASYIRPAARASPLHPACMLIYRICSSLRACAGPTMINQIYWQSNSRRQCLYMGSKSPRLGREHIRSVSLRGRELWKTMYVWNKYIYNVLSREKAKTPGV